MCAGELTVHLSHSGAGKGAGGLCATGKILGAPACERLDMRPVDEGSRWGHAVPGRKSSSGKVLGGLIQERASILVRECERCCLQRPRGQPPGHTLWRGEGSL